MRYYQIGAGHESDETSTEPFKKRELKGHTEGPHSPFGLIWQIASATGWTPHYILWHIPYTLLILMAADAPRYVDADEAKRRAGRKYRKEKGSKAVDFFQTKLEGE